MSVQKPREIAVDLLQQRQQGQFIESLLDDAQARSNLKPEDRRFLQELVYGVVRWELTLDWLIAQKTGGKPQKGIVQNLLRSALYQMFWLDRVPSYAVLNETVEIAKRKGLIPQARFINAVLRGYDRETEITRATLESFQASDLALAYSHPEWLCRRWEKLWGREKTVQLLRWNNSPPPLFARVNRLKVEAEKLSERWHAESVRHEAAMFDWARPGSVFRLLGHPPLSELPSFQEGLFYVQDPSTLLAPKLLDPQPNEAILDLCSAPGGKTTVIAQLLGNTGVVFAEDLDRSRLAMVEENSRRLGATCVQTAPADPGMTFDRVLLDAPCSNTGVMRRRIELRWRIKPDEIQRLASTQLELLGQAARRVKESGTIVYSTCSLEPEENRSVIERFLEDHPEFALEDERALTPMDHQVDGAYCARLKRSARK